ncbi:MAG: DNA/RNA nuclease SfsA [Chloroflexi bacterium]|nr:DNA/RNA nuclease SfsA [Chloroflexota bacterium]
MVTAGTRRMIGDVKFPPLIAGRFVRRDNRFRVAVEIKGEHVAAHLPNSGRLTELLTPGRPCWLSEFDIPQRKTRFDLVLVKYADTLISMDARLPNALFAEALASGQLEPFQDYDCVEREVRVGKSRLDFRLRGADGVCWVEVKSVTLVEEGVARFPDAPTARGVRHLGELSTMVGEGDGAAVVFIVQRSDARRFVPHDRADPDFGVALREAAGAGVGVYAWTCEVSQQAIAIAERVPVGLV